LPTDFYLSLFVITTVLTLATCLWMLYAAREARGTLRHLRNFYVVWVLQAWLVVLAVYLQEGFFEGAAICTMLSIWGGIFGLVAVCFELFRVMFTIAPDFPAKIFEVRFKFAVAVWILGVCSPLFICGAVFARDPTHERFNYVMGAHLVQYGTFMASFVLIMVSFLNRFMKAVLDVDKKSQSITKRGSKEDQNNSGLTPAEGAMARVNAVVTMLNSSILGGVMIAAVGIAFFATDGQIPYLWIFYVLVVTAPLQGFPQALTGMKDAVKKGLDISNMNSTGEAVIAVRS
jgi:hypothetical protein